jgi:hypothetical protein
MSSNDYFIKNYNQIEYTAKLILRERWREGISEYYIYIVEGNKTPSRSGLYYYLININKKRGKLNFVKGQDKTDFNIEVEDLNISYSDDKTEMMMDLNDENIVDFLLNNPNNSKWLKIYEIVYEKKIELNLFEGIIFDYIFIDGFSIKEISAITGNSKSWTQQYRKSLIDKIKKAIVDGI